LRPRVAAAIAAVREGDTIVLHVANRQLNVDLSDAEIASRMAQWSAKPRYETGVLAAHDWCRRRRGGSHGMRAHRFLGVPAGWKPVARSASVKPRSEARRKRRRKPEAERRVMANKTRPADRSSGMPREG
jgi:hypothetical protein